MKGTLVEVMINDCNSLLTLTLHSVWVTAKVNK